MKRKSKKASALGALALAGLCRIDGVQADQGNSDSQSFSLFASVSSALDANVNGYLQLGASINTVTPHDRASGGYSNTPIVGPADEGAQFNELFLAIDKPLKGNIIPRVTPTPAPMPVAYSFGYHIESVYGRDGLPSQMIGVETKWNINRTPDGDLPPGSTRQNYLSFPNVYVQAYLPWASGIAVMAGRFGVGVGHDIPPDARPSPNFFYSKTYTFISQPDQGFGVLMSANLMHNDWGLAAAEFGAIQGRQLFKENNDEKTFIGALRWRSPSMQTWIDYSFEIGDEQNSPSRTAAMPVARIISPSGQLRQHHSLSATLHPLKELELVFEGVYGKQAGDGRDDTIDILTGPNYAGGEYHAFNAEAIYTVESDLRFGARAERFIDPSGIALYPVTAVAGAFNQITVGARYSVNKNVDLRPEIRYDWQDSYQDKAFGGGRASSQATISCDALIYF